MFCSKVLLCPVTALKYLKPVILSGEGPWLHVYDEDTGNQVQSCCVFIDAAVHGIESVSQDKQHETLICVYGAKQLRILQLNQQNYNLSFATDIIETVDWIWDVKWLNKSSNLSTEEQTYDEFGVLNLHSVACVLGHNSVIHINFSKKALTSEKEVHCEEKCIVYCAHCIGSNWDDLIVASGTVFNQIVLWKPSICGESGRSKVLHRLVGHEGVIFSIDYNFENKLIASVSDDRSIRLWKIEKETSKGEEPDLERSDNQQDTYDILKYSKIDNLKIKQQSVWYGHSARVWKVKILKDYIVSIGEDCTCCVWNYDGNVIMKYKGHKGKSIWSLAISEDERSMVTGGGDCSVRIWSLDTEDVGQNLPTLTDFLNLQEMQDDNFPRTVSLLNHEKVLTMTNEGILWSHNIKTNDGYKILDDDRFKSYSMLSCMPFSNTFAVGSIHGTIKICQHGSHCLEKDIYKGKVHSILWLHNQENETYYSDHAKMLTSGPDGRIDIWEINWQEKDLKQLYHFILPYTKQRWVSAALLLQQEELLVCGDRGGTVHVYSISKESTEPINSFWKIHGKSGVTDLCALKENVYSAGRDGQYRIYDVSEDGLQLLSSQKVYKGLDWIAQLKIKDSEVLVLGFHADHFVVYSTAKNQKLVTVPCGGGHRAWDFSFDNDCGEEYNFVYIKNRDVVHCQGKISSNSKILKHSLHGRELCDIKHLFSGKNNHVVVTAGEDTDVNVLALFYNSDKDNLSSTKLLATLQGHLSSVRALAVTNSSDLCGKQNSEDIIVTDTAKYFSSKLLFSGGGRAEIKVWKIFVRSPNHIVHKDVEGTHLNEDFSCSHKYLATHSLSKKRKQSIKPWRTKDYNPNPETRYMDLCVIDISNLTDDQFSSISHLQVIAAACSDSLVRVIAFNEKTRKFQILAECCYHEHCVLKVKSFNLKQENDNQACVYILSAATDGKFAIWDFTSILKAYVKHQLLTSDGQFPLNSCEGESLLNSVDLGQILDVSVPVTIVDVHQSGVNALDIIHLSENEILIATGGDDNAITITKMQIISQKNSNFFKVMNQGKLMQAHAAQVTGLKWMSLSSLLSVSIDQRLILWHLDGNLNMKMKECNFVNISDVSNIDMWNAGSSVFSVGLCGVGLQCLNVAAK